MNENLTGTGIARWMDGSMAVWMSGWAVWLTEKVARGSPYIELE